MCLWFSGRRLRSKDEPSDRFTMMNECGDSPQGLEMLPQGWNLQKFGQQYNNFGKQRVWYFSFFNFGVQTGPRFFNRNILLREQYIFALRSKFIKVYKKKKKKIYIYIQEVCKSIFAWNSAQYVEAEQNKYYERKKRRNYISRQACFVNVYIYMRTT